MKRFLLFLLLFTSPVFAADYHIGSGQTYTTIGALNWQSLVGGDHVYIHYGTYSEMIWVSTIATEGSPLTIEGVPDGSGNLPILDGNNMVIPSSYDGHLSEYDTGGGVLAQGYGMFFFHWDNASYDASTDSPNWINVKNFEVKNTTPESYTFTNTNGLVQAYPNGNAGIYIKTGQNITFENLVIHDVGNGIESQGVDAMNKNITLRYSHIYDFGRTDGRLYLEHGIYTESSGLLIEYNTIGPARDSTANSTIKSRGADTVIRYNKLYAASRLFDLVEPENQSSYACDGTGYTTGGMHDEPGFDDSWVYGNIIINEVNGTKPYSGYPVHYGYDNCPAIGREGTLHFYNNTVIHDISAATDYNSSLFDLSASGTVEFYNNVILSLQDTNFYLARHSKDPYTIGTLEFLGGNYINTGYEQWETNTGTWTETVSILTGGTFGLITDIANEDFSLATGSSLINAGVALPTSITTAHNVGNEYDDPLSSASRADVDDIGAYIYGTAESGGGSTLGGGSICPIVAPDTGSKFIIRPPE